MSRVFVSGPMRGHHENNVASFDAAETFLAALGHDVVNPANLNRELGMDPSKEASESQVQDMMARDLHELTTCDTIAFLPGWESSRGAQLERSVAEAIGLDVYHVVPWVSFKPEAPTLLVGLSGYAQTGKDTVGQLLVDEAGFSRLAFADALKDVVRMQHPKVDALVRAVGWEGAKESAEIRSLLQHGGAAAREVLGEDVWVNAALRSVRPGGRYVITDVRYRNEAEAIRTRGGYVVRVSRPGFGPVNSHASETDLDSWEFDAYLKNDGSVADLARRVRLFARSLPEVQS